MIQAGKENSQNQVLIYFVQTAIGRPDSVFIYVHNEKAGFPLVEGRSCGTCDQLPYPA